jgi:hypothetical protein
VQDRVADDVGQFLKVALMRWLVSPSPYGQEHRLGVVWFQEPGRHHRVDGDHLAYLHPSHDAGEELRSLDPDLYDRLRQMAAEAGRAVSLREACRALPKDSVRFDRPLTFDDLVRDDRAARTVARQRWFHEAMVSVAACSLVFLDSDVRVAGDEARRASGEPTDDDGASMAEIARLLERGQSVVTHQVVTHQPVDGLRGLPDAVTARLSDVHDALGVEPLALVRESDDCTRLFMVVPHDRHRSDMQDRIGALQLSRWGNEFRVYRWRPALVTA